MKYFLFCTVTITFIFFTIISAKQHTLSLLFNNWPQRNLSQFAPLLNRGSENTARLFGIEVNARFYCPDGSSWRTLNKHFRKNVRKHCKGCWKTATDGCSAAGFIMNPLFRVSKS